MSFSIGSLADEDHPMVNGEDELLEEDFEMEENGAENEDFDMEGGEHDGHDELENQLEDEDVDVGLQETGANGAANGASEGTSEAVDASELVGEASEAIEPVDPIDDEIEAELQAGTGPTDPEVAELESEPAPPRGAKEGEPKADEQGQGAEGREPDRQEGQLEELPEEQQAKEGELLETEAAAASATAPESEPAVSPEEGQVEGSADDTDRQTPKDEQDGIDNELGGSLDDGLDGLEDELDDEIDHGENELGDELGDELDEPGDEHDDIDDGLDDELEEGEDELKEDHNSPGNSKRLDGVSRGATAELAKSIPAVLYRDEDDGGLLLFPVSEKVAPVGTDGDALFDDPARCGESIEELFGDLRQVFESRQTPLSMDSELAFAFTDLDLELGEDNVYCKEVTLYDMLRLYEALRDNMADDVKPPPLLKIELSQQPRFMSKYNEVLTMATWGRGLNELNETGREEGGDGKALEEAPEAAEGATAEESAAEGTDEVATDQAQSEKDAGGQLDDGDDEIYQVDDAAESLARAEAAESTSAQNGDTGDNNGNNKTTNFNDSKDSKDSNDADNTDAGTSTDLSKGETDNGLDEFDIEGKNFELSAEPDTSVATKRANDSDEAEVAKRAKVA